jgi:hypothetical protein
VELIAAISEQARPQSSTSDEESSDEESSDEEEEESDEEENEVAVVESENAKMKAEMKKIAQLEVEITELKAQRNATTAGELKFFVDGHTGGNAHALSLLMGGFMYWGWCVWWCG